MFLVSFHLDLSRPTWHLSHVETGDRTIYENANTLLRTYTAIREDTRIFHGLYFPDPLQFRFCTLLIPMLGHCFRDHRSTTSVHAIAVVGQLGELVSNEFLGFTISIGGSLGIVVILTLLLSRCLLIEVLLSFRFEIMLAHVARGIARAAASAGQNSRGAVVFGQRAYHEKVVDHYDNPRNVGSFDKNDPDVGTGLVGAPACGDVMKLQIKVDEKSGEIIDACFKTFGCGSAIASSSVASEWIKGKAMEEAVTIKNSEIAKHLSLPPVKLHCSMLAEDAIKAAVKDYKAKKARISATEGSQSEAAAATA